ncbi:Flp family type IVb pilin [Actinomarinicola tropica]|uniref:Flp family type IVb pilin n=1 Tax=Actinomarinicola tropica TaxID=2789776 RepID=A0A5Q2RM27_9ACTN|nr:Flp family type IVb pilin [Actinomarinicola tropica]QGG95476.1 Flp family type IVb pilin [Actinomarinicola tropica]
MSTHSSSDQSPASHLDDSERGASLVEYALLVALIAVVCIGAVAFLGETTGRDLSESTSQMFLSG